MSARDLLQRLRSLFAFGAVRSAGHDIFISYRREAAPKAYAKALRDALEERGKRCFFDEHSLATGDDIERLKKEARRSRMFLLVGTRSIFESVHIPAELAAYDEAHRGWIRRRLRRIFPINVRRALTPYEMPTEDLKKDPGSWKPLLGLVTEPETDERFDSGEPSPELVTRIGQSSGLVNSTQIMLAIMAAIAFCIAGLGVATLYFGRSVAEGRSELAKLEETRQEMANDNSRLSAEQVRLEGERTRLECDLAEGRWRLKRAAKDLDAAAKETSRQRGLAEEAALRATIQRGEARMSEGYSLFNQGRYELAKQQFDGAFGIATATGTRNFAVDVGVFEVYRHRPPSLWALAAHAGGVNAIEFSPDEHFLLTGGRAAGSGDAVLMLWDAHSGRLIHEFKGHGKGPGQKPAEVHDVAFSPDGETFASAGSDGTVRLWNYRTREPKGVWALSEPPVTAVAFTLDGNGVAAGGRRGVSVRWVDRERIAQYPTRDAVEGVALGGPRSRYIAVTTSKNVMLFDEFRGPEPLWTVEGHKGGNRRVTFVHEGIAVASATGRVSVWDLKGEGVFGSGTPATSPRPESRGIATTPDGRELFYATRDNDLVHVVLPRGEVLATYFHEHSAPVTDIAVSSREGLIASASADGTVRLWPIGPDPQRTSFEGHAFYMTALDLAANDRLLLSASYDGPVIVRDADTLLPLALVEEEPVGGALLLPGDNVFTAGWKDLGPNTRPAFEHRQKVPSHANLQHRRKDLPDGAFFLEHRLVRSADRKWMLCSEVETAVVRRVGDQVPRGELKAAAGVTAMALSRDGSKALVGAKDGTLRFWLLREGHPVREHISPFTHDGAVASVTFLPKDTRAVSCGKDGTIRVFDPATEDTPSIIFASMQPLLSCAAHPDGRLLAVSSADGSVRLWDLATATQVGMLYHGEERQIEHLVFDTTGNRLFAAVSAAGRNGGLFWDFNRAAEYRRLLPNLPAALAADRRDRAAAVDHQVLGQWYTLRGRWSWAVSHLEKARGAGAPVRHEELARLYHRLERTADARREVKAALASGEIPRDYAQVLLAALPEKSPAAPAAGQRP